MGGLKKSLKQIAGISPLIFVFRLFRNCRPYNDHSVPLPNKQLCIFDDASMRMGKDIAIIHSLPAIWKITQKKIK